MMNNEGSYGYTKGSGYQAGRTALQRQPGVAMDIIMPDAGNFTHFESNLTADTVSEL